MKAQKHGWLWKMNETNYIERYWRDAKPEDAIKEPPMVSRFKLSKDGVWFYGKLYGIDRTRGLLFVCGQCVTPFCQVYDAPDPGEGWRLIDTASEKWQEGDEFQHNDGMWDRSLNGRSSGFSDRFFYRRRITPSVTYVPFTWEDREQLRGRWIGSNDGRCQRSINTMHNDNGSFCLCAINAESLCTDWHFLDTGEPVGKEVRQ